ncbi:MAG: hypothetical protein WC552_09105 [Candidatus Omnitrophota bacterium]
MNQRDDKIFIVFFLISTALIAGVVLENLLPTVRRNAPPVVLARPETERPTDTGALRRAMEKKGLVPYEAKYWKAVSEK